MTDKREEHVAAALEALLFTAADAVPVARLAKTLGVPRATVTAAVAAYNAAADARGGGLRMLLHDDAVQLMTAPAHKDLVARFLRDARDEPLSDAALEVLAVVAYRGPVTRGDIEAIRGVNCGSALRRLLLRGLIARERHPDAPRMYRYRVTADFLAHCGVARPEDLPDYAALRDDPKVLQSLGAAEASSSGTA